MPLNYASPIVCNPRDGSKPTSTVIFLHGLGDQGAGWADAASQFQPNLKNTRFVFPNAPRRPITLNGGMAMPGWFDIASLDGSTRAEDQAGIEESTRYVQKLIDDQGKEGIPPEKIAVCGFSQGGAVALYMLRTKVKLGAVIGMSTWLPLSTADVILSEENKSTPILMCHGDADQVVSYRFGRASHAKLASAGADVDFATYAGMPHSACPQELKAVEEFLVKNLTK